MSYPIESNIPFRESTKYPLDQMQVGDSFFVPNRKISSISSRVTSLARRRNITLSCRTVDGGMRVWRIA